MVFPVVMYGCESWTIKKAECQRMNAFELWCWRRFLRVPWPARRSKQSILKEISPGYSLEGLMLKLKCQYFGHLIHRADSFEKTLMLGKIEGGRRRGWPRMRWLDGITNSMDMSWVNSGIWWWTGRPGMLRFMGSQSRTQLSNWTELNWTVVLEKTLKSPLDCKEIQPVNPKGNQSWIFIGRIDAEAEIPILWPPQVKKMTCWKRPWCWERLKAGGEGDNRGWDGWMASPTRWTWVWVNSGCWWWPGRPEVLQSMGSQRVRHNWETELN